MKKLRCCAALLFLTAAALVQAQEKRRLDVLQPQRVDHGQCFVERESPVRVQRAAQLPAELGTVRRLAGRVGGQGESGAGASGQRCAASQDSRAAKEFASINAVSHGKLLVGKSGGSQVNIVTRPLAATKQRDFND